MSGPWGAMLRAALGLCVVGSAVCLAPAMTAARADHAERRFSDRLRDGPGTVNHPVGVVPSAAVTIPAGWPLDHRGSITCLTCHQSMPALDGSTGACLRDFDHDALDRTGFCAKCHDTGGAAAAAAHWRVMGAAHQESAERADDHGPMLDAQSKACLNCHDGVNATDADNEPWATRPGGHAVDLRHSHPIGVPYERAMLRATTRLRPAFGLPRQVRLPGGMVGCVSCHNLYAPGEHKLTIPIEESQLCYACHEI